jgi:hypothetical protein
MLNIQMGNATLVMLEAMPETICPSQIMKSPRIPFGRCNAKFSFDITVSISQRIGEDNPQDGGFSYNVISNAEGSWKA